MEKNAPAGCRLADLRIMENQLQLFIGALWILENHPQLFIESFVDYGKPATIIYLNVCGL